MYWKVFHTPVHLGTETDLATISAATEDKQVFFLPDGGEEEKRKWPLWADHCQVRLCFNREILLRCFVCGAETVSETRGLNKQRGPQEPFHPS